MVTLKPTGRVGALAGTAQFREVQLLTAVQVPLMTEGKLAQASSSVVGLQRQGSEEAWEGSVSEPELKE